MDRQVVDAHHLRVGGDDIRHLLHKLRVGSLAQQGRHSVLGGVEAGVDDEHGHQQTGIAVDVHMEEIGDAHGEQNHRGGYGVGEGVGGSGLHGGGIDLLAHRAVIQAHIELHQNAAHQNDGREQTAAYGLGVEDLFKGAFDQLEAHQDDNARQHKPGQILGPAVAEGVIRIGLFPGNGKAQQGDDGGTRVRQVVEGVRRDGHGAGDEPGNILARKEQQVQENPVQAAHGPVGPADGGTGYVFVVFDEEFCQQLDHSKSRLSISKYFSAKSTRFTVNSLPRRYSRIPASVGKEKQSL